MFVNTDEPSAVDGAKGKIKLVLYWHMHQPEYRDLASGEFILPWTYLHVIKDYVDMVAHLEAQPHAKAVINFAPILLEQIAEYAQQVSQYLQQQTPIRDAFLAALVSRELPTDAEAKLTLIKHCLRAHRERQINRYPAFAKLAEMVDWLDQHFDAIPYLTNQFIADLLVWYHLVWLGETVKLTNPRVQHLIAKGAGFTFEERVELIEIIGDLLSHVLCRYHALMTKGQIELSMTPYAHPIMPLLLAINSAREAMPDVSLPELTTYPGGAERVRWQLEKGLQVFKHFFGITPHGCWPSEGSVCAQTLKVLAELGFTWTASGGAVLRNSLQSANAVQPPSVHFPFQLTTANIACFFRDDGLSDKIGFDYSSWHADDAVADLIGHLETIAAAPIASQTVAIIMDGENAWEHFPENGYHFLQGLYRKLADHPNIELCTFSDCLQANIPVQPLLNMVAGSWVYGNFATWIGNIDKNRAWEMLIEAKYVFDQVLAEETLSITQRLAAEQQLAICEGSDWFWWFGDYNPSEAVSNFEKQFRLNLSNLYCLLNKAPPAYLALSFTQGHGAPAMGGTMRLGSEA